MRLGTCRGYVGITLTTGKALTSSSRRAILRRRRSRLARGAARSSARAYWSFFLHFHVSRVRVEPALPRRTRLFATGACRHMQRCGAIDKRTAPNTPANILVSPHLSEPSWIRHSHWSPYRHLRCTCMHISEPETRSKDRHPAQIPKRCARPKSQN